MSSSGGGGKPTPAQVALENEQANQSAMLDQQENLRRKRLLSAAQGLRVFRGSALSRAPAGNSVGAPSLVPPTPGVAAPAAPRSGPFGIPLHINQY